MPRLVLGCFPIHPILNSRNLLVPGDFCWNNFGAVEWISFGSAYHPFCVRLRLAIHLCLQCRFKESLAVIAVVCSSWSMVNAGTSQRDILCPYGASEITSVRIGNIMVARRGIGSLKKSSNVLLVVGSRVFCFVGFVMFLFC